MIQFEMKRFLSVARWDMTINKKFYMSQVACLLALAVSPVVFQYLLWWSSGSISIFDFSGNTAGMSVPLKNTLDVGFFHVGNLPKKLCPVELSDYHAGRNDDI